MYLTLWFLSLVFKRGIVSGMSCNALRSSIVDPELLVCISAKLSHDCYVSQPMRKITRAARMLKPNPEGPVYREGSDLLKPHKTH